MKSLRRKTFTFENTMNGEKLDVKAYSESRAWRKIRRILEDHLSGPLGFTYNVTAFNFAMKHIRLIEEKE